MMIAIIEYVISPVLVAFMGWIVYLLKEQKKSTTVQEKGLMLLLRREIIESHRRFCDLGEQMTALDYSTICEINDAYQALGGNGMTERLFEDIKSVEVKTTGAENNGQL